MRWDARPVLASGEAIRPVRGYRCTVCDVASPASAAQFGWALEDGQEPPVYCPANGCELDELPPRVTIWQRA